MRPVGGIRRDLRLSIGDGAGYGAMAGVAEVYLPAFALALGMPPVLAGLVATAPLLAGGLLQTLAPRAIVKVPSLRRWVVGCVILQAFAFVPLVVIALRGELMTPLVFVAAAIYWAAGMAASAGWNPWMARVVPARIRSKFFGRRQGLVQATMLVGLIGAGAALHTVARAYVLDVYAGMFALAFVARMVSAVSLSRMGEGVEVTPRRRMRFRSIPDKLRGSPRASLLAYLVAASAAASISGAFITPYLLHEKKLDYAPYAVFTAVIVVSKIVFSSALGRLIARAGVRKVLGWCALGLAPIPALYVISDAYPWLLFIQFYGGIVWGGYELGVLIALFDAEDDSERTTMQVAYGALLAVGNAGASFIGGAILASLGSGHEAYLWVFLVSAFARFAAAVLVVRNLPRLLFRLPGTMLVGAWTLAIRPWGGTIVRPILEGVARLRRPD